MSRKIKIKHSWNKARFSFSFFLLLFYLVIGCIFLFTDIWGDLLAQGRFTIGMILISFGMLRFYIGYRRFFNKSVKIKALREASKNVIE